MEYGASPPIAKGEPVISFTVLKLKARKPPVFDARGGNRLADIEQAWRGGGRDDWIECHRKRRARGGAYRMMVPTVPKGLLFAGLNGMVAVPPEPLRPEQRCRPAKWQPAARVVEGNAPYLLIRPAAASTPVDAFT